MVEHIWQYYNEKLIEFTAMTPEKQKELMSNYEMDYSTELMIYAYDNFDTMKLLLISAGGTRYENFLHELVEKEIESTHSFMKCMEKMGMKVAEFNPYFEHTITSGMFNSLFELIVHDVPVEEALECSKEICKFYQAGWSACMGLK